MFKKHVICGWFSETFFLWVKCDVVHNQDEISSVIYTWSLINLIKLTAEHSKILILFVISIILCIPIQEMIFSHCIFKFHVMILKLIIDLYNVLADFAFFFIGFEKYRLFMVSSYVIVNIEVGLLTFHFIYMDISKFRKEHDFSDFKIINKKCCMQILKIICQYFGVTINRDIFLSGLTRCF